MLRTAPVPTHQYEAVDPQFGAGEQDPINVQSVIRFIKRSWKLAAIWLVAGLVIGILFLAFSRSYFTAHTTLLLEDRVTKPLPEAGGSDAADAAFADSQVQVLESREVIGRVVTELGILDDNEFGRGVRGLRLMLIDNVPGASLIVPRPRDLPPEAMRNLTIMRVNNALSVQRIGMSNAVDIAFTSRDPDRAAQIANAIAKAYVDTRVEIKQRARDEAAAQLRDRLADAREKAFNTDLTSPGGTGAPQTGDQARDRFRELQSTTETYRALYNSFLQRYTEAVQQLTVPGARVISPAEPPLDPSWPSGVLTLALAGIGGLGLGIGHALLRQLTNSTLRDGEDLHKATGLDCLAEVQRIHRRNWRLRGFGSSELQQSYLQEAPAFNDRVSKAAVYLLATRINSKGSTIGIASVQEGGGASSVAAHMARVFAQSGLKTLLIDANWKEPMLYQDPSVPASEMRMVERMVPVDLDIGTLDVLVIRGGYGVTDLNASQAVASAILRVQGSYACVIVDFHGLDRAADIAASMTLLDDVILVAEAGRTTAEGVGTALRSLPREKISLVMNKVDG